MSEYMYSLNVMKNCIMEIIKSNNFSVLSMDVDEGLHLIAFEIRFNKNTNTVSNYRKHRKWVEIYYAKKFKYDDPIFSDKKKDSDCTYFIGKEDNTEDEIFINSGIFDEVFEGKEHVITLQDNKKKGIDFEVRINLLSACTIFYEDRYYGKTLLSEFSHIMGSNVKEILTKWDREDEKLLYKINQLEKKDKIIIELICDRLLSGEI